MSSNVKPLLEGLGLAMSNFQPINKTRRTSKPAAENNSPAPAVSPTYDPESLIALEACASNFMRASSSQAKPSEEKKRKSPMVVVSAKATPQALVSSEGSDNPQTPLRKKRKTMKETPKAPREQAPRDAKLLSTVEHSTTSTPAAGADSDSDWSNSSERLEELDSSMSTQTPHRRSPRHRPSSNSSAEFSSTEQCIGSSPSTRLQRPPLHEISGNAVKREGTASRDRSVIRPRSMSPSGYNKEIRDRKMQAEGLVELPPAEWRYQQYMRIKEEKKNAKRLWKDELRKQKGKEPERALEGNAGVPSKALGKKKAKADRKPQKARKRQKKSHKRVKEEPIDVDVGLQPVKNAASRSEHPPLDPRRDQSGKSALSKKQSKMTIHEDSHPEAVVLQSKSEVLSSRSKRSAPKSSDKEMLPQRSTASGYIRTGPRSWLANQTQISRPWQQAGNRREWSKAESSSAPNGKENENGTSNAIGCPGDWLSSSRYAKPSRDTCALYNRIGQREKGLSSEQMTRGRQQSSIEPKSFYGKQPECRVTPTLDSSPSITDKGLTNENKHRDAEQSTAKDIMTPPDAPPASKGSNNRRKSMSVHVPLESNVEADWRPMFDNDVPLFPTSKSSILTKIMGAQIPSATNVLTAALWVYARSLDAKS